MAGRSKWNEFQQSMAGKGMSQKSMAAAFKGGAGATVKWNSAAVTQPALQAVIARMKLSGEHLKNAHVMNLSTPVTKIRKKRRRTTSRGAKGSSYTYADPASRSKPGEFPRAETGELRRNTFSDVEIGGPVVTLIVGTSKKYGERLETKMGRLGLRATLLAEIGVIQRIMLS